MRVGHLVLPCPNWLSHGLKAETKFTRKQVGSFAVLATQQINKVASIRYVTCLFEGRLEPP